MNRLKSEYCGIREGVTYTPTGKCELVIYRHGFSGWKGWIASLFISPIWEEDYHDNRSEYEICGYLWKMGKAEYHYRLGMNDKHAKRWMKRHKKAVRT